MKRSLVLFFVITLVVVGVLPVPSPPGSQGGAVATLLNEVVPTGECQTSECGTQRLICSVQANYVQSLCLAITQDEIRCKEERFENYRSCVGLCG